MLQVVIILKLALKGASSSSQEVARKKRGSVLETDRWVTCGCWAGYEPGIVLDPFMGSGTAALVARRLGRRFIGIELKPDYIKIVQRRLERLRVEVAEAVNI